MWFCKQFIDIDILIIVKKHSCTCKCRRKSAWQERSQLACRPQMRILHQNGHRPTRREKHGIPSTKRVRAGPEFPAVDREVVRLYCGRLRQDFRQQRQRKPAHANSWSGFQTIWVCEMQLQIQKKGTSCWPHGKHQMQQMKNIYIQQFLTNTIDKFKKDIV